MSVVRFGSARIAENGGINGAKGDQKNGAEVAVENYYMSSQGWIGLRAFSEKNAQALAQAMKDACANDCIGYGQADRDDVFKLVKAGTKIKDIKTPSNCDCSSLVRACILEALKIDVGNFNTASEVQALLRCGQFATVNINSDKDCMLGDILVTKKQGHTVICVEGYSRPTAQQSIEAVAKEVIAGKWGNGTIRKSRLEEAGYNYYEVQKAVNQLLG